ncbi:hypothetical protein [Paraburkholderia sp. SIMBA_030]|uniref:hypothetical protein n=1 Tax=Paraburkholderia sp. SIMBA_030 TaxID=3085773 RepID=UPI00397A799D
MFGGAVTDASSLFDFNDEPVAVQNPSRFSMSRRVFLGGVVSTPLIGFCDFASAAPPPPKCEERPWSLRFELSPSTRELAIIESPPPLPPEPGAPKAPPDDTIHCPEDVVWRLPASAFGPNAWFDMARPADLITETPAKVTISRRILVRKTSYGRHSDEVIQFVFIRRYDHQGFYRWTIKFETGFWSDGLTESNSVTFEAFVKSQAELKGSAATGSVVRALTHTFTDLIEKSSNAPPRSFVSLDRHLQWMIYNCNSEQDCKPEDSKPFLAVFDRQVQISTFQLGWRRRSDGQVFFGGRGLVKATTVSKPVRKGAAASDTPFFVLDGQGGQRVNLFDAKDQSWSFEIRTSSWPYRPDIAQTVMALRIGSAMLSVDMRDRRRCGRVPVSNLILSVTTLELNRLSIRQRRAGDGSTVRTVLWGNAFSIDVDADKDASVVIESPIGMLRVGAPALETVKAPSKPAAPDAKTEQEEQQKKQQEAKPTKGNCSEPTDQSSGTGDAANDDSNAVAQEQLWRAANGDRLGAPSSSVFIVQDRDDAHGRKWLRRISIDVALLEASVAPADTSFSLLSFARADLRLHYEDGVPLTLGGPPEGPRPHANSFVWLGPDPLEKGPRAVLDLSTSTLTCARDYDLMKLRFRFSDLNLTFREDMPVYFSPANEQCRVLVSPDGVVTDGRPVLVVEFDPQHVMEEAILWPEPLPLPDVVLPADPPLPDDDKTATDRASIVQRLHSLHDRASRARFRAIVKKPSWKRKRSKRTRRRRKPAKRRRRNLHRRRRHRWQLSRGFCRSATSPMRIGKAPARCRWISASISAISISNPMRWRLRAPCKKVWRTAKRKS